MSMQVDNLLADFLPSIGINTTSDNGTYQKQIEAVEWIEKEFYIPELNGPIVLADYQRAFLKEADRKVDGKLVYDFVLLSDIKKSAKSTIAAAMVLYRALHTAWGTFIIVANSQRQADSRVFAYITRAIELNPTLKKRCKIIQHRIEIDNHTIIEAIPCNPRGEAGANPDMVEYTELHAFTGTAAEKLWTETTLSPTKHGYSQRFADTYAGNSGESPILEPLYDQLVKPENRVKLENAPDDLEVYRKDRTLCLWNTYPRLNWQTPEYYKSEASVLTPTEFRRVHLNQWVSSVNVFVPPESWDRCVGEYPEFNERTPMIVALDAAAVSDTFAIVGVSKHNDIIYVRYCHAFVPPKNGVIDFDIVKKFIKTEVIDKFNVVQICYDPYQLTLMATQLRNENTVWVKEFPQGEQRLKADRQLYDLIVSRQLIHNNHPTLTAHIKNANQENQKDGSTLRLVKRADHLKIDCAVALSMSSYEAKRLFI